jgi:hypothetical protein
MLEDWRGLRPRVVVVGHHDMWMMARRGMWRVGCDVCLMDRRDRARVRALLAGAQEAVLWSKSCSRRMWRVSEFDGLVKSFGRMEGSRGTECSGDGLNTILRSLGRRVRTSMAIHCLYNMPCLRPRSV